jgi:hypothetical protein
MSEHHGTPSSGEVAMGVGNALVGLGLLTMALFPLSIGGLLLFVIAPIAIVVAPLVLIPALGALLATPFILVFRLIRALMARRTGRADRGRRATTGGMLIGRTPAECRGR